MGYFCLQEDFELAAENCFWFSAFNFSKDNQKATLIKEGAWSLNGTFEVATIPKKEVGLYGQYIPN